MTVDGAKPSVFDAGLPTLTYDLTDTPQHIYPQFRAAQEAAPIALGPIGPEVLSYGLARTVLRDPRFVVPRGIHLSAHGITSGPLWDRVTRSILNMEGDQHRRLRSLVSRAFTPRATARMHDTIHTVVNELIDRVAARMLDLPTTIARMNIGYSWTGHGGLPVMMYHTMKAGQPWPVPIGYDNVGSPTGGVDIGLQAHKLLEIASVPATVVNWGGDDPVSDREMGEYVADLTGITVDLAESPISFDSFPSDNRRREQLIGKCSVHWKDGVRDTFERLGLLGS